MCCKDNFSVDRAGGDGGGTTHGCSHRPQRERTAYVYLAIEALADGGVKMGLSRPTAALLAAQTFLGAARMVLETGEHPGQLKDRVASPGGTTIAGLHELERGLLRAAIMNAVEAATQRSGQLGRHE